MHKGEKKKSKENEKITKQLHTFYKTQPHTQ